MGILESTSQQELCVEHIDSALHRRILSGYLEECLGICLGEGGFDISLQIAS